MAKVAKKKTTTKKTTEQKNKTITPMERNRLVAKLAYEFAEQRGFMNGSQDDDWMRASREIDL